jgi:hypothetical protein
VAESVNDSFVFLLLLLFLPRIHHRQQLLALCKSRSNNGSRHRPKQFSANEKREGVIIKPTTATVLRNHQYVELRLYLRSNRLRSRLLYTHVLPDVVLGHICDTIAHAACLGLFLTLNLQWCETNFSSIEDIENCQNRGGFRQNIESIEEMLWFSAPLKWAYLGLSLRGS